MYLVILIALRSPSFVLSCSLLHYLPPCIYYFHPLELCLKNIPIYFCCHLSLPPTACTYAYTDEYRHVQFPHRRGPIRAGSCTLPFMPLPLIVIEMPVSTSRQESKRRRESRHSVNLSSYLGKPWQSKSRITLHGSQKTQQLSESSTSRWWSSSLIFKRLQSHGIQSGKTLQVYKGHTGPVTALAFCDKESRSGDNKILITGSRDRVTSSQNITFT